MTRLTPLRLTPREISALLSAVVEIEAGEMTDDCGWTDELAAALSAAKRKLGQRLAELKDQEPTS